MKLNTKTILLLFIGFICLSSLLLVLVLTEKLLSIWTYLKEAPTWVAMIYLAMISMVAIFSVYLYIKFIKTKVSEKNTKTPIIDENSLKQSIHQENLRGVDTQAAELEMHELSKRRQDKLFYIALFGQASTGKSSLIQALIPDASVNIDARSGSTLEIKQYHYQQLMIIDLPGFDAADDSSAQLENQALEEARRAHVVLYLVDSDISRQQMYFIEKLNTLKKPLIITVNKVDRYAKSEKKVLITSIENKINHIHPVVSISTGGKETIIYHQPDGTEKREIRARAPQVGPLIDAIEKLLRKNPEALHLFRDAGLLMLANDKLNNAVKDHDYQLAEKTIANYTQKAVAGALASVAPGSDLVIQGAIATRFIKKICAIYSLEPKQIELDQILKLTGGKIRTSTSLVLAIAGNACKAFPGIGTAAGGMMHAVAYGMIFNALGKAVLKSIVIQGELNIATMKSTFEDNLLEHSTKMAKNLAQMAFKIQQKKY